MPEAKHEQPIDWSLTTWEGARREQLRRWRALTFDEVLAALEEMEAFAQAMGVGAEDRRSKGPEGSKG